MKRLLLFIGLLLSFNNLFAQKKVTENYATNNVLKVAINLKFAKDIQLKNWNKNTVKIEAEVNINNNTANDKFSLQQKITGKTLEIKSDYDDLFKKNKTIIYGYSKRGKNYSSHNKVEVNYVVYIPKNVELTVKSISGDVKTGSINNKLKVNLVSGDIEIKEHFSSVDLKTVSGDVNIAVSNEEVNAETVSGDIDIAISDAKFKAETVSGDVYSDLDITFDNKKKKYFGKKIIGTIAKGIFEVKLKTVSGDVFLRKP